MINSKLNRYSLWHMFFISIILVVWFIFRRATTLPILGDAVTMLMFQLLLLFYIFSFLREKETIRSSLGLIFKKSDILLGFLTAIINLFFAVLIASLLPDMDSVTDKIPHEFNMNFILLFLPACIVGPIMEEIVIRGYFWKILELKIKSRLSILIITSLIFALFHFELYRLPILFVSGIIFGFPRFKSGRLGISIVAHIVTNILVFLVSIA